MSRKEKIENAQAEIDAELSKKSQQLDKAGAVCAYRKLGGQDGVLVCVRVKGKSDSYYIYTGLGKIATNGNMQLVRAYPVNLALSDCYDEAGPSVIIHIVMNLSEGAKLDQSIKTFLIRLDNFGPRHDKKIFESPSNKFFVRDPSAKGAVDVPTIRLINFLPDVGSTKLFDYLDVNHPFEQRIKFVDNLLLKFFLISEDRSLNVTEWVRLLDPSNVLIHNRFHNRLEETGSFNERINNEEIHILHANTFFLQLDDLPDEAQAYPNSSNDGYVRQLLRFPIGHADKDKDLIVFYLFIPMIIRLLSEPGTDVFQDRVNSFNNLKSSIAAQSFENGNADAARDLMKNGLSRVLDYPFNLDKLSKLNGGDYVCTVLNILLKFFLGLCQPRAQDKSIKNMHSLKFFFSSVKKILLDRSQALEQRMAPTANDVNQQILAMIRRTTQQFVGQSRGDEAGSASQSDMSCDIAMPVDEIERLAAQQQASQFPSELAKLHQMIFNRRHVGENDYKLLAYFDDANLKYLFQSIKDATLYTAFLNLGDKVHLFHAASENVKKRFCDDLKFRNSVLQLADMGILTSDTISKLYEAGQIAHEFYDNFIECHRHDLLPTAPSFPIKEVNMWFGANHEGEFYTSYDNFIPLALQFIMLKGYLPANFSLSADQTRMQNAFNTWVQEPSQKILLSCSLGSTVWAATHSTNQEREEQPEAAAAADPNP